MFILETPFVGCDTFISNERGQVLLIQRSDNQKWALPGGSQNRGETMRDCAIRETFEETGLRIEVTDLLGIYSSMNYEAKNYPYPKRDYCHVVFMGKITGGSLSNSEETLTAKWFSENQLPDFSDGHDVRVKKGFAFMRGDTKPHFE